MADIPKADPAKVARIGFKAMFRGEADVVAGFSSKVQVALAKARPEQATAQLHRELAEPRGQS